MTAKKKFVFVSETPDLTHRFSTELCKKETDGKKRTYPEEPVRTLSRERRRDNLNTTEQMETTARDWKESKISLHAGVRGGNKRMVMLGNFSSQLS